MANPIPEKQYTVESGDTLESIAARAYGDPAQSGRVGSANGVTDASLYAGLVLNIPPDPVKEALKNAQKEQNLARRSANTFTLIVEGVEIPVMSGRLINSMDTISGMWAAEIAWQPGADSQIDELLRPFRYPTARVFLGPTLVHTGAIYGIGNRLGIDGSVKVMTGYSRTIDLVDSSALPPYEASKVTLQQRVESFLGPYGISAESELTNDGQFDRVTIEPEEKIFDHLKKLAAQRAALIGDTAEGNVRLYQAATTGAPVGTLEEGSPGVLSWSAEWDGRKRYNTYRVTKQSPLFGSKTATAKDSNVPKSRILTFAANDVITGSMQDAAEWRRSKTVADTLVQSLPVSGWYAPNGELWQENTFVTVKSKTLRIPDGYKYLIKSVEFEYSNGGNRTTLTLVPPEVYTGGEVTDPWQ